MLQKPNGFFKNPEKPNGFFENRKKPIMIMIMIMVMVMTMIIIYIQGEIALAKLSQKAAYPCPQKQSVNLSNN